MELLSLQSPPASRVPLCSSKSSHRQSERSSFLSGQPLNSVSTGRSIRRPESRRLRFIGLTPRTSGAKTSLNPRATGQAEAETSSKDGNLAFVAGATGRVGSRTVRELLKLGFRVRAGVRNIKRADSLLQSVKQMNLDDAAVIASEIPPIERLELVECNLERESEIGPAIGDASVVICSIGASEKEALDFSGPYRIDYKATVNLIDAATASKVDHFVLVTSLGTNKIGFPAALLNLFWGVLLWKRKAEEALIASGIPYTIVRPGGMERPTDSFKETHNLVLADGDTYFGGLVSNLQVAELVAFMAKNRSLAFCKVVEAIAETTAPLTPIAELLSKIPAQREDPAPPKVEAPPKSDDAAAALSSSSQVVEEAAPEPKPAAKAAFLSPYPAYEGLKPPTSPTPTPSTKPEADNGAAPSPPSVEVAVKPAAPPRPSSPFVMYDDLKPPSSPSPSAPVSAPAAVASPESSTAVTEASPADDKPVKSAAPPRPSSPFAMYEDLKPPTSPTPSLPK